MNMNKKENQRVRITKMMFQDGLISLLEEKPLYEITITELCNVSGLNRSTFYNYYDNISDILKEITDELYSQMESIINNIDNGQTTTIIDAINKQLYYIKENSQKYQVLLNNSVNDNFTIGILKKAVQLLKDTHKNLYETAGKDGETLLNYVLSANIAIVKRWLNTGTVESPEYITDIMYKLSETVLKMYIPKFD